MAPAEVRKLKIEQVLYQPEAGRGLLSVDGTDLPVTEDESAVSSVGLVTSAMLEVAHLLS